MPLDDLSQAVKDTTRSCVFDWPDRPIRPIPPVDGNGNPFPDYPYMPSDDWPPPPLPNLFPPPNPVTSPNELYEYAGIIAITHTQFNAWIANQPLDLRDFIGLPEGRAIELFYPTYQSANVADDCYYQTLDYVLTHGLEDYQFNVGVYGLVITIEAFETWRRFHIFWCGRILNNYRFFFPNNRLSVTDKDDDVVISTRDIPITALWQTAVGGFLFPQAVDGDLVNALCVELPHYTRSFTLTLA